MREAASFSTIMRMAVFTISPVFMSPKNFCALAKMASSMLIVVLTHQI